MLVLVLVVDVVLLEVDVVVVLEEDVVVNVLVELIVDVLVVLVVALEADDEVVDELDVDVDVLVPVDELELVPVLELELVRELVVVEVTLVDDVVDNVDVVVDVVVDDVVVDTDVVALDVTVDVTVVDGDVISQLKNVPSDCRSASSFIACCSSCERDSPVFSMMSSFSETARTMCTSPDMSMRQSRSKNVPLYRPWSCSVISRSKSCMPSAVLSRHTSMSFVVSTMLYFKPLASWSGPRKAHPMRSPKLSPAWPLPIIVSLMCWQSARATSVLIRFVTCVHSCRYGVCTYMSAKYVDES